MTFFAHFEFTVWNTSNWESTLSFPQNPAPSLTRIGGHHHHRLDGRSNGRKWFLDSVQLKSGVQKFDPTPQLFTPSIPLWLTRQTENGFRRERGWYREICPSKIYGRFLNSDTENFGRFKFRTNFCPKFLVINVIWA